MLTDRRHAYFDIVAKVATLEIEGLDASLRYDDVRKVFRRNSSFSPHSAAARRINKSLNYLHDSFPESFKAFRHRTIVQSIITLVCHLQQVGLKPEQEHTLKEFIEYFLRELSKQVELGHKATDPNFLEFQRTVNANVRSGPRTRQTILLRELFREFPNFFSALSHSAEIAEGLNADIANQANTIRDLIASCNERYAAQNGSDLFKPTNKTVTALAALGTPVTSLEDYKTFIENLYFIFREGIGQRLDGQLPASFVDVNDLRTMLQHDVDHGKAGKVAAKRKHLASVFSNYSGYPSPDAIDPSQFVLVQANILGTLSADLSVLAKSLV